MFKRRWRGRRTGGRGATRGALGVGGPALVAGLAVVALTASGGAPRPAPVSAGPGVELEAPVVGAATAAAAIRSVAARRGADDTKRPAPPRLLRIRAAGIAVSITASDAHRGELEIPPVDRVGWVRSGPRPGEPGRAVLIGHRDSSAGAAPFAALATLQRGTPVEVLDARGRTRRYRVSGVEQVPKSEFPAARVYAPTGHSTLALITCEGVFEQATGYEDNLIVYARRAVTRGGGGPRRSRR